LSSDGYEVVTREAPAAGISAQQLVIGIHEHRQADPRRTSQRRGLVAAELKMCAEMKMALTIVEPHLKRGDRAGMSKVVIGAVAGDLSHGIVIDQGRERQLVNYSVKTLRIRTPGVKQRYNTAS
jgi:hypothetical protein